MSVRISTACEGTMWMRRGRALVLDLRPGTYMRIPPASRPAACRPRTSATTSTTSFRPRKMTA
eukprot:3346976-Prymnesium_polylepis.1